MSAHRVFAVVFASVMIALAFLNPATAQGPGGLPPNPIRGRASRLWAAVSWTASSFTPPPRVSATPAPIWAAPTAGTPRPSAGSRCSIGCPYEDPNLMGVESIAVDPSDPNRVYLACGTYTNANTPNGAILRSSDRGRTFERTNVPFKFGGNEDGRGNGERMTVDPNNGKVLYLGTRQAGLWRSTDGAVTWNEVDSFPDVTEAPPAGQRAAVAAHNAPPAGAAGGRPGGPPAAGGGPAEEAVAPASWSRWSIRAAAPRARTAPPFMSPSPSWDGITCSAAPIR